MREHRDIAEFEARTKIRAKYLRALEDEEWGLLPGYTFAKAFLRTYADMLGLDGRGLVDEFKRQYQDPSEVELAATMPTRGEGRRSRERGSERDRGSRRQKGPSTRVLAIAVLVVALAAALFIVHELRKKNGPGGSSTTTTTSSTTSRSKTHVQRPPRHVGLALIATSSVRVCLIGYRTAHGGAHTRYSNTLLTSASPAPVLHADNHFLASFAGGTLRMVIDGHSVAVDATVAAVAYEIFLDGRYTKLSAAAAPRCP